MARNHQLAPLVALFAEEEGVALRTAQWHAKGETDRWKAFLARKGGAALTSKQPTVEMGRALLQGAKDRPMLDLGEVVDFVGLDLPEEMEARHAQLWRLCMTGAEQSARDQDATSLLIFTKMANEAWAAYQKARHHRVKSDLEMRRLVPASEFDEFRQVVMRVADLVKGIDVELAPLANPDNPAAAAQACRNWLDNRLNPAVRAAMAA